MVSTSLARAPPPHHRTETDCRTVVRTPEEAAGTSRASFDYVLLCVKALPDVYDIASVIESVVSPQHTCILINTTHTLGVEQYLENRFPTNVVLSLVSGAEIAQLGASEFEHKGSTELWVGAANKNPSIPASIQTDMAEALAMTLKSGQVDCEVSPNIRQQQYDRMIGYVDTCNGWEVRNANLLPDPLPFTRRASSLRRRHMQTSWRRSASARLSPVSSTSSLPWQTLRDAALSPDSENKSWSRC
jgi:hypothetical protein